MGVMRAVVMIWAGVGGAVTLERLTDAAFQSLAEGFPEQCELRSIVADAIGTGKKLAAPLCRPASGGPDICRKDELMTATSSTSPGSPPNGARR